MLSLFKKKADTGISQEQETAGCRVKTALLKNNGVMIIIRVRRHFETVQTLGGTLSSETTWDSTSGSVALTDWHLYRSGRILRKPNRYKQNKQLYFHKAMGPLCYLLFIVDLHGLLLMTLQAFWLLK